MGKGLTDSIPCKVELPTIHILILLLGVYAPLMPDCQNDVTIKVYGI